MIYESNIEAPFIEDRSVVNRFLHKQENLMMNRVKKIIMRSDMREEVANNEISKIEAIRLEQLKYGVVVTLKVNKKLNHDTVVHLNRYIRRECGNVNNPSKTSFYEDFMEDLIYSKEAFRTVIIEENKPDFFHCTPFKLMTNNV